MATVDKNFRIKNGLVVEGTTGTINGHNILTESTSDSYILNLVGGSTLVKSVDVTVFNVDSNGFLTVNANVFDAYGAADTAQSNAESYTDSAIASEATNRNNAISSAISTEVTNRNSAIATALSTSEGYADTAASNALSSANSYTDSEISSEVTNRNSAIATAKSQAISTAEGYADTAAQNAQNAAESYTDSAISSEVSRADASYDPAGSAANAITTANSYTNSAIASATTTIESYADTAAQTAQNAAEGYADTVATNAENAAKSYTDTKVADLVNGAPSTLDTLKKIDDAINNDASFSATLLSDITNAITTSEGYTDTSIAQEVIDRNLAISSQASTTLSSAESYTDTKIAEGNATATPTYEALNVNAVSLIASAKVSIPSTGVPTTAYSWDPSIYRTAKALVKFSTATHTQVTEVLLTLDSANNVAITQYGEVGTNGELGSITANYSAGVIAITVTTNQSSTDVMTYATLIQ